jgi:hypothetical protein
MNKDYQLLDEALAALLKTRTWLSAEYYKMHVNPVVIKLKERLASLEVEKFVVAKKKQYYETVDYNSTNTKVIEKKIKKVNEQDPDTVPNKFAGPATASLFDENIEKIIKGPDTIPNKLIEATTNFGLFNSFKSEYCKSHPAAPHRYLKELSESMGRYVCECEFWEPKP